MQTNLAVEQNKKVKWHADVRSADSRTCLVERSRNQFGDRCFATAGPTRGTFCLNSFGNRTSPSDNSNDRWKRSCLVSWAVAPCVWTL